MSRWGILVVASILVAAPAARAETWNAGLALIRESSSQACAEVPQVMWTLSLETATLSGRNNFGATFTAPIGPDGAVRASYTGRAGSNETFEMVLTGNARTRQLEVFNVKDSCRYRFNN